MRHILAIILLLSVGMSAKAQQIYSLTTEEICLDSTQIFVNYYNGFGKNGVPFQEVHSYMDVTGTQIYPDTSQLNTDCLGAPDGSLDSLTIDFIGCGRDTIIIMDTTIVIRYDTNIWLCDTLPCEADFWTIGDTTYLIDNQCDTTKICLGGGLDSLTIDFIGCNRDTIIVIDTTIVIRNDTNVWVCDSLMNLEIRQDSIICIELSSGQEYCDTLSFPEPCQLESYLNLSQDTFFHYDSDCDLVIVPLTQYPSQDTSYVINDSTIVIVNVDGSSDTLTILGDEYIPCPNESYISADTFYHIDSDCDTLAVPLTTPCIDSTWYGAWNHQEDTLFHRNILCELDTIIRENHSCFYVCDNGDSIRVETSVDISVIPPVIVIDTIKRWGLVCDTLGFGNMLTVHIDGHGKPQIDLGGPAAHPGNQEHTTVIQHNDFQMNWINENQVYLTTRRNLCTLFPELECDSLSYAMYSVNNSNGEGNTSVVAVSEGCTYTYSSLSSDPTFVSGIITCSDKLEIRGDAGICFTSDQDSVFMTVDSHFVLQRKPDWIMGFVADATKIWADTSTFGVPPPGCDDDGIYAVRYNFDSLLNDVAGAIPQPECDSMFFEGTTGGKWANHCDTIKFISGTGTDSIDVRSGSIIIDINTIYNEESVTGTGTDPTLAMCAAITGPPGTLGTFTDASGGYWVVRKNSNGSCTTLEMPQDSSSPCIDTVYEIAGYYVHQNINCSLDSMVIDSSCNYRGTRTQILSLKNSSRLVPGCRYCITDNNLIGGGDICMTADDVNTLTEDAQFYSTCEPNAGWETVYDIDNNQFLYFYDGIFENEIKGWTEINRWYNDGMFCNPNFRENYIEDATVLLSGATGLITNNSWETLSYCDFRSSSATIRYNSWASNSFTFGRTMSGIFERNNLDSRAYVFLSNTTNTNFINNNFSSNGYFYSQVNDGIYFASNSVTNFGYWRFNTNSDVDVRYTNSNRGYVSVTGTNQFTANNLSLTSNGRISITGDGTYTFESTKLDSYGNINSSGTDGNTFQTYYSDLSSFGYILNTDSGCNLRYSSFDSYGYVRNVNSNPTIYYHKQTSRGYLYLNNAETPRFYYNNIHGVSQMQVQNTTGLSIFYGNELNSGGRFYIFGGTPRGLYNTIDTRGFLRFATLTGTVQQSKVSNARYKNMPSGTYSNKLADIINDNW